MPDTVAAGPHCPEPDFGAFVRPGGVEFRVFSRSATAVTLLLFEAADPGGPPTSELPLGRTGDVWHAFVPRLGPGALYGYRAEGPDDDAFRFDPAAELVDPAALAFNTNALAPAESSAYLARGPRRARSVVAASAADWPGPPPRIPLKDSVIYEVHLRGFTAGESSGVRHPGTYAGFAEKVGHLQELGVTAVEFLPLHEFDPYEHQRQNPLTGARLSQYWGYSTVGFFAPHGPYAAGREPGAAVAEFQALTRALRRAGIETILDVVYNHTGEGHHQGPTLHYKGLDNPSYYLLRHDRRFYDDYTGCGNTVRCDHPVPRRMILDSLRHWASRMGVDGFRFDLAAALCRDRRGALAMPATLIDEIAHDPALRDCKMIAEPWDARGGYLLGGFPRRFAEWNDRYRDDIRQFWRGDRRKVGAFATRLMGSSDLFEPSGRAPWHSINFVCCHDGFTLEDLLSYSGKRNEANGEGNHDGSNDNWSSNHGFEGPSADPAVEALRQRQAKNLLATLFVSQGVPMLLGGDEFRRTQGGNNNAYCQDNDISWFDWTLKGRHAETFRFCRELIAFRKRHPALRRSAFFKSRIAPGRQIMDVNWHSFHGGPKIWEEDDSTLQCHLDGAPAAALADPADDEILLLVHAESDPRRFRLAGTEDRGRPWRLAFDTSKATPEDFPAPGAGPLFAPGAEYALPPKSLACFTRPVG